jgi:hypothetical protein
VEKPNEHTEDHAHALECPTCARLLKRIFDLDIEHCPHCGGALKIIAVIAEPAVIVRIRTHLGLPADDRDAIALAPVRRYDSGSRQ